MTGIEEAKNTVIEFLQKVLDISDIKVIGATKIDNQWHIEAEVYEDNSFIKSLGLPTKVRDKNIYDVSLNENMEVESYERQGHTISAG